MEYLQKNFNPCDLPESRAIVLSVMGFAITPVLAWGPVRFRVGLGCMRVEVGEAQIADDEEENGPNRVEPAVA